MAFVVCPKCARHVKRTEAACPFCGADVANVVSAENPTAARSRTRRGLLFGTVAGIVASGAGAASCSDDATNEPVHAATDSGYGVADVSAPVRSAPRDTGADAEEAAAGDASNDGSDDAAGGDM